MKAGDLRAPLPCELQLRLWYKPPARILSLFLTSLFTLLTAAAVVFWLMRKLVVRPLSASVELANRIAANDLSVDDLVVDAEDEIGETTAALNQMKNNLREIVRAISGTAVHVASASEELSSSASQQANGAETQNSQTTQVATAMQEMSSTVLQVSENSNRAAEASRHAAEPPAKGERL